MDGYIVDTPGFSNVDFHGMDKYAIRDNMNEMFSFLEHCKYRDCMHIKEDGCQVKKMVETNQILTSRYKNYKQFIEKSFEEGETYIIYIHIYIKNLSKLYNINRKCV